MNNIELITIFFKIILPAILVLIIFFKIIYPILRIIGSLIECIFLFVKECVSFVYIQIKNLNTNNIAKTENVSTIIKIV